MGRLIVLNPFHTHLSLATIFSPRKRSPSPVDFLRLKLVRSVLTAEGQAPSGILLGKVTPRPLGQPWQVSHSGRCWPGAQEGDGTNAKLNDYSSFHAQVEPPPKNNWRQKHESFIRTLRQAREIQQVIAKGGNPSELPPIAPVENPDYIQCPHCSRHFAPKVAERHIPKCKTIRNRPPPPRKHCS